MPAGWYEPIMVNLLLSWPSPWNRQRRKIKNKTLRQTRWPSGVNTYCVVFFFYLYSSWVPYTASFSGLSIFDYSSVFFDVYLEWAIERMIIVVKRQIIISSAMSYRATFWWSDDDVCFAISQHSISELEF